MLKLKEKVKSATGESESWKVKSATQMEEKVKNESQPAWKAGEPTAKDPPSRRWVERCTSPHTALCTARSSEPDCNIDEGLSRWRLAARLLLLGGNCHGTTCGQKKSDRNKEKNTLQLL